MKLRVLLVLFPLILWTCATPPVPPRQAAPAPVVLGPDDDHRSVSIAEFQASPWQPLVATGWKAGGTTALVTLADGRVARLGFVATNVVRWWVPSAPGEAPYSPGAIYPSTAGFGVKLRELDGVVALDTPALGVRLRLSDLSLTLVRGDRTVVSSVGGPLGSGRRLIQRFSTSDQVRWFGPQLTKEVPTTKFWVGSPPLGTGAYAIPSLIGTGGTTPVSLVLDNSYQTYSQIGADAVSLGALNGGLDLLIAAAPQPGALVEALTAFTGRPSLPPQWAFGTALVLPEAETGTFVRKARLSIQTAFGPVRAGRPRFQALVPGATPPLPPGSGTVLAAFPGRVDWSTPIPEGPTSAPLARMNNQLPSREAQTTVDAWQVANPGLRPLVLAGSGSWGSIRYALPEIRVTAGQDSDALVRALALGSAGLGTPAVRLDLTPLAVAETRAAAFQSLLNWLLVPVLTLDWGTDPGPFWAALPDADRSRLKAILDRRSQFKPLFAQVARQAAATGRPAWAPLWFLAPSDPQALASDEFVVADSLVVAPLTQGASSRSVFLPGPGVWFDFWTGEEFGGGRAYDLEAPVDRPLLFARGGALVPVREAETFDDKDLYNPLTIHVFPGGRGSGTYYLDDGRTLASRGGASWETRLVYDFAQKDMTLDHVTVATTGQLKPDPYLLYRIHNVFRPKQVRIDGKPIPLYGDSWGITDTDRSAAWYEGDHTLLLKTFKPEREQTIVLSF